MKRVLFCLLLSSFFVSLNAQCCQGPVVNLRVSLNWWNCTRLYAGTEFAIVQVSGSGGVEVEAVPNIINARQVGYAYVAGFIVPCYGCGNAAAQISDTINTLTSNNAPVDELWIYASTDQYWSRIVGNNTLFLHQLVNQSQAMGVKTAIWTTSTSWTTITNNTNDFSSLDLAYTFNLNNNFPNYGDFVPFGGWTTPSMKNIGEFEYAKSVKNKCRLESSFEGLEGRIYKEEWMINYIAR